MLTSDLIHLFHWVVYVSSFIALICLFTGLRKWGALWIAILFASQAIFNGCLINLWENYYRVQEGLATLPNTLLVDRFSSNPTIEIIISAVVAALSMTLFIISFSSEKYE